MISHINTLLGIRGKLKSEIEQMDSQYIETHNLKNIYKMLDVTIQLMQTQKRIDKLRTELGEDLYNQFFTFDETDNEQE